jgi:hypothetical protein
MKIAFHESKVLDWNNLFRRVRLCSASSMRLILHHIKANQELRYHKKQSSTVEIFELLTFRYCATSNFEESKRKLQVRLERDYKQLASFLRTDVYYVPPAIEEGVQFSAKDLSQKHDPFRFTIRAIDQEMGLRLKKITEMEEDKVAVFGFIWGLLSYEPKQVVERHMIKQGHEDELVARESPLALLWIAINATHIVAAADIPSVDAQAAYERYENLRQLADESILYFKRRFDEAISAFRTYQLDVPRDIMQTRHFM